MKIQYILYGFFVFFTLVSCVKPDNLMFPQALNNEKTSAHTEIPGTRMSIVLPGFLDYYPNDGKYYAGHIGKDSCMLLFAEFNNMGFYELQEVFKQNLYGQVFSVEEETYLTVNNFDAVVYYVNHDIQEDGYILLFGDSTFVVNVTSIQHNHSQKLRKQIFESLTTVYYDKNAISKYPDDVRNNGDDENTPDGEYFTFPLPQIRSTSVRTEIPGTKMSIVLPQFLDYYTGDQSYVGSVDRDTCMILFREVHGISYYEYVKSFRPKMEKAYQSVSEEIPLKMNDCFPGVVLYSRHSAEYDGYHILFGDSTFYGYVMSSHSNRSQEIRNQIFESLTTVSYDKDAEFY